MGALPVARMMSILRQMVMALDHAHERYLVRRDIRPANIIIEAHDQVSLTAFGLVKGAKRSKITGEGAAMGTLVYMSPEQAFGQELDRRSDVYSLGVIVYEMLAGETPSTRTTPYWLLRSLMYQPRPRVSRRKPEIHPGLEQVVGNALSKEPRNRYDSAGKFYTMMSMLAGLGSDTGFSTKPENELREVVLLLITSAGREYPLCRGRVTVGRETSNDIVLPVRQVSRHQAQIYCGPSGCSIMDLSTNGTFVNGVPIPPRAQQPIWAGDVLQIGPVRLGVTLPARPGSSALRTTDMAVKAD